MFFYLTTLLVAAVLESNGQETCWTHWKSQSTCVDLTDCPALMNLILSPSLTLRDIDILKSSQCGHNPTSPKVCCPIGETLPTAPSTTDVENRMQFPDVSNHPNRRLINEACGRYSERRIVNGNKTEVLEFPWMALIAYDVGRSKPKFKCGGSLISKRYVLTAAHCVTELGRGIRLSKVRLGEHDLSKERDCDIEEGVETVCAEPYQEFAIESFHAHTNFSKYTYKNDIALIRLSRDVNLTVRNVMPICMPEGHTANIQGNEATVSGWGITENDTSSQELLQAKIPIVSREECAQIYERHGVHIRYQHLCAGGSNGVGACTGDSGGPLQTPNMNTGNSVQYGVVSGGPQHCGTEGMPTIFTNVPYYMDWILDNMTD